MSIKNNTTSLQNLLNAVNALPEAGGEQATPEISVATSGLITATAGSKSSTYQLAFQAAKTITPSTVSQIAVSSGYYTGGNITVAAVPTQTKSVTPTTVTQNVTPDSGKFLSKVTVAGDSNLVAGNIKSGVSIFGVNGTLKEGGMEGEKVEYSENEDAILTGAISNYINDRITIIRCAAFQSCYSLRSVSFSACTSIGSYAFQYCFKLASASFPACTNIDINAFQSCGALTTASFPVCTSISNAVFKYCYKLTSVSFPVCTNIGNNAFLKCGALTIASFPVCTSIGSFAFQSCQTLSIVQLGASSVCKLSHSNAFFSTPFTGYSAYFSGTPHIYVPSSLITAYQSATNWAYFSSYFSSIEGLESNLITFTIDGSEYQAEEGMIWEEWAESGYNIGGFYSAAGFILKNLVRAIEPEEGMAQMVVDSDGTPVNPGDTIRLNHAYQTFIN